MKTTKFFLAVLAISAMFACSKSDDLPLTDSQSTEMDAPGATNLKASTIQQSTLNTACSMWQFTIHTYVASGSYRHPNSNLYAQVNFETSQGNRSVNVPLTTTGFDDYDYGGNDDYEAQVCLPAFAPIASGWIKLKSAKVILKGNGLVKLHFLDIRMQTPEGNSRATGDTYITPNNPYGLADLGSRGVYSYDTGNIGEGIISIQKLETHKPIPPIVY